MHIKDEELFGTSNYRSHPIVLTKGDGVFVYDVDGKKYFDYTSGLGACGFGHSNKRLLNALNDQASKLSMCSRAYHSDRTSIFLKTLCQMTGFDKAMPLNTGVEAVEAMIKACRLYAYKVKKIEVDRAEIIAMKNSYHGRTLATISLTDTNIYRENFGPLLDGVKLVPFNDINALKSAINKNTCAIITEPIQGEAGVIIPDNDYFKEIRHLCDKNEILLALDEVQSGIGRTGFVLAQEYFGVKADLTAVGKSLGGGILPVSALLGSKRVMELFTLGVHGSTFGGNPLAMRIGYESLILLKELLPNIKKLSTYFYEKLSKLGSVKDLNAIGFWAGLKITDHKSAKEISLNLLKDGILIKEGRDNILRLFPPYTISNKEINESFQIINNIF